MTAVRAVGFAFLVTCCLHARAGNIEAFVKTSNGKPVEDAAVVVEPASGTMPLKHKTATIEQFDREFIPYLTIVQTGTAIEFPNRDPFKHHIYSFSPAKVFGIKLYAGKPAQPVVFDKPGEVALGCNIHDWMEAYILVVNSSYFAKTNKKGRALINDVPAGQYRLRLWHPREKVALPLRDIEIADAPIKLDLVTNIGPRIIKSKPPLDADEY